MLRQPCGDGRDQLAQALFDFGPRRIEQGGGCILTNALLKLSGQLGQPHGTELRCDAPKRVRVALRAGPVADSKSAVESHREILLSCDKFAQQREIKGRPTQCLAQPRGRVESIDPGKTLKHRAGRVRHLNLSIGSGSDGAVTCLDPA